MKGIQLIGTNFPKIRYAFMSKIKPNNEDFLSNTIEENGKIFILIS